MRKKLPIGIQDFASLIKSNYIYVDFKDYFPDIMAVVRDWYNGYSWDGKHTVYNPFSILNLLSSRRFDNFWFTHSFLFSKGVRDSPSGIGTGTPTFLIKLMKQKPLGSINWKPFPKHSLHKPQPSTARRQQTSRKTGTPSLKQTAATPTQRQKASGLKRLLQIQGSPEKPIPLSASGFPPRNLS